MGWRSGSRSSEHDVSVVSATNVMRALDPQKYDALPVITREGRWRKVNSPTANSTGARPASKSASYPVGRAGC